MTWMDTVPDRRRQRLLAAWHDAGCPGGDAYIDWLIDRGELYTRAWVDADHDQQVKTLRFDREQHDRNMQALRDGIDAEHKRLGRVVAAVQQLVNVRRKTLRMDDLRGALRAGSEARPEVPAKHVTHHSWEAQ